MAESMPPPSTAAIAVAVGLIALTAGYFLGQGSRIGIFSSSGSSRRSESKKSWPNSYDVTVHPDSSDEELMAQQRAGAAAREQSSGSESDDGEDEGDGQELKAFPNTGEEVKLVLAVRTDLGMGKGAVPLAEPTTILLVAKPTLVTDLLCSYTGKIAAQCSHATLACYKYLLRHSPSAPLLSRWERAGQAKIAVQVKSEDELTVLQAQAMSLGLCARVIHDAGRTQIAAGSSTVLGVLGPKSVVDQVTGGLKLL